MPRKTAIPVIDGDQPPSGRQRRQQTERTRLTENLLYRYRPYYVGGRMELTELAGIIADDMGLPEGDDASRTTIRRRLSAFASAHGWKELRREYQERLTATVEVRLTEEAAEQYLATLRTVGDSILAQGFIHAQAMAPRNMTEAMDMIRVGKEAGLRGRNMPETIKSVTRINVDAQLEQKLVDNVQALPAEQYAALAESLDAVFAEPLAGRPAAERRVVPDGTDPQR